MKTLLCPSRFLIVSGLTAVFALLCVSQVRAQTLTNAFGGFSESSDKPIDIESDLLTIYPDDHATFSGNVKAVQGTTTLRAREIKVNYVGGDKEEEQVENAEPAAAENAAAGNEDGDAAAATEAQDAAEPAEEESTQLLDEPINIVSDWLLINDKEKYAEFKGNVKFRQGSTKLNAKELKISYAASEDLSASVQMGGGGAGATQITKMEARGDVRALFLPSGSEETDGEAPADSEDAGPQNAVSSNGEFDVASAANPAGAASGAQSQPSGASTASPDATAQTPIAGDKKQGGASLGEGDGDKGITKIEANGDVVISSQKDETTTSDWLVYDLPQQTVTVGGNVVLTQKDNVVRGDRLAVDLQSGETRLENTGGGISAGGGRIRALFLPKDAPKQKKKRDNGAVAPQPLGGAAIETPAPPQSQFR